jgi:hypothetical protein
LPSKYKEKSFFDVLLFVRSTITWFWRSRSKAEIQKYYSIEDLKVLNFIWSDHSGPDFNNYSFSRKTRERDGIPKILSVIQNHYIRIILNISFLAVIFLVC